MPIPFIKMRSAVCDISVSDKIVFDKFKKNQALGSLILIDRITNMTSRLRRCDAFLCVVLIT